MSEHSIFQQLAFDFDDAVRSPDGLSHTSSLLPNSDLGNLFDLMGPIGWRIKGVFHRMQLAEDVIEQMKGLYPGHRELIHRSFGILYGTDVLSEAPEKLYIAHCKELIVRVTENGDTRLATNSELLGAIKGVSLIVPLKRHAVYLYWKLFQQLFPDLADGLFGDNAPVTADDWDLKQAEQLHAGLLSVLSIKNRTLR